MEPKNWDSAVPFAYYLALVGYYADDAMNMAAISIKDDHVAINVVADLADGTRMFWDMEVCVWLTVFNQNHDTVLRLPCSYSAWLGEEIMTIRNAPAEPVP